MVDKVIRDALIECSQGLAEALQVFRVEQKSIDQDIDHALKVLKKVSPKKHGKTHAPRRLGLY
ncbi:MAG: hypothetical protein FWF24_07720 [Alphaproteobacteria bacterium]|nr:hypothetical protein [Alphaproteobacteria bacterium]